MSNLTDRIGGARSSSAAKAPCRVATTANITLSGYQTIDDIVLADGDANLRVLVKNQTDTTENGIWDAGATAWTRAKDCNRSDDLSRGTMVYAANGTVGTSWYKCTGTDPITVGTSAISWTLVQTEVTEITAGAGLSTTGAGSSGGSLTTSGTITSVEPVNVDSTQAYTYLAGDHGKLVVRTYAGAMSDTLPAIAGSFNTGYYLDIYNAGTGVLVVTASATINGLSTLSINPGSSVRIVSDGTTYRALGGSSSGNVSEPQGRLTLTTATAIMTSTVSGATTVYYTPAIGRYVPIYDGSRIVMSDIGGELSQLTTDTTKSPAACTTNSNYDLFVWKDGTTFRCTRGPAWSTSTSRGTGAGTSQLATVAGLAVNAVAITNGPGVNLGTYVGTIRTNGSSQVDYKFGSSAAGGGPIFIGVWNAYNQTIIRTTGYDSTASWTYAGGAVRNSNNSASNRISFIKGLGGSAPQVDFAQRIQSPAGGFAFIFLYLDGAATAAAISGTLDGVDGFARATYNDDPGIGFHYLQCSENCSASSNYIGGGTGSYMQFSLTFLG